jgi:hypothetical protein
MSAGARRMSITRHENDRVRETERMGMFRDLKKLSDQERELRRRQQRRATLPSRRDRRRQSPPSVTCDTTFHLAHPPRF